MASNEGTKAAETAVGEAQNATTPGSTAVTVKCHCGRVQIELPYAPTKLNECRCSVCYSYGVLWAYYRRTDVMVTTAAETATGGGTSLQKYVRDDAEADGDVSFNRCGHCGCVTHWWGEGDAPRRTGPDAKMGVNCRMLPEKDIEAVERIVTYC